MSKESYSREIQNSTNKEIGILLGKAIKDPQLTPEAYNQLCKEAKTKGFSFGLIEFIK